MLMLNQKIGLFLTSKFAVNTKELNQIYLMLDYILFIYPCILMKKKEEILKGFPILQLS